MGSGARCSAVLGVKGAGKTSGPVNPETFFQSCVSKTLGERGGWPQAAPVGGLSWAAVGSLRYRR